MQVFKLGSLAQTKDIRQNIAKLNLKLNFNVRGDEIRLRSIRKEILYLFGLAGIEVWLDESIRKILPTKKSWLKKLKAGGVPGLPCKSKTFDYKGRVREGVIPNDFFWFGKVVTNL